MRPAQGAGPGEPAGRFCQSNPTSVPVSYPSPGTRPCLWKRCRGGGRFQKRAQQLALPHGPRAVLKPSGGAGQLTAGDPLALGSPRLAPPWQLPGPGAERGRGVSRYPARKRSLGARHRGGRSALPPSAAPKGSATLILAPVPAWGGKESLGLGEERSHMFFSVLDWERSL